MEFGNPMPQIPPQVIPAIDHAIETGVADPERIGLYGHSYGSYTALALLVQTDRFRAAVVSGPAACNLTSVHSLDSNWCENGQGRLGCAPWEDPDVYVKNSPFFFMGKVNVPILVISIGEREQSMKQDMAIFRALQRLDRRVELRRYERGDHALDSLGPLDLSDCYTRILEWYMEYLVKPIGSETAEPGRI
jgi:dipeptidyl aminopeptidase/acylaminoacyl peptidase